MGMCRDGLSEGTLAGLPGAVQKQYRRIGQGVKQSLCDMASDHG